MRYRVKKETRCNVKNRTKYILCGIVCISSLLFCSPKYVRSIEDEHNIIDINSECFDEGNIDAEIESFEDSPEDQIITYIERQNMGVPIATNVNIEDEDSPEDQIITHIEGQNMGEPIATDVNIEGENNQELNTESEELSYLNKIPIVLEYHNITEFELFEIISAVAHEAGSSNYQECYDVVCTMYNRTLSTSCCNFCAYYGLDGKRIINQIKCPDQFAGYLPGIAGYDKDLYIDTAAYKATIDFLYTLDRSHNYLNFNAPDYVRCPSYAVQLNPDVKGNKFFSSLQENDLNDLAIELGVNLGISR